MPAEGGGSAIDRKALRAIRELGLPAIVKACVSCRSTRHHPTGKFRVNANGKLLDVWMLICCELYGRTSKIPIHERVYVQALESERLLMFENKRSGHGAGAGNGRGAGRQGCIPARLERHMGTGNRQAVLRTQACGSGAAQHQRLASRSLTMP